MLTFLVVGCVEVEDIGGYWDEATLDPRLEGVWVVHTEDSQGYIKFTRGEDGYVFTSGDLKDGHYIPDKSSSFIKSLEREDIRLLLVRDSPLKNNRAQIFPYRIVEGRMEIFHIKGKCSDVDECTRDVIQIAAEIKTREEENGVPKAPMSLKIAKLNDESLGALVYLFNNYHHWDTTIAKKAGK